MFAHYELALTGWVTDKVDDVIHFCADVMGAVFFV